MPNKPTQSFTVTLDVDIVGLDITNLDVEVTAALKLAARAKTVVEAAAVTITGQPYALSVTGWSAALKAVPS